MPKKILFLLIAVVILMPIAPVLGQAPATQSAPPPHKTLDIYFIDTEGGQSTLFAPPSGEAFLYDTGTKDQAGKQLSSIMDAIKQAGFQWLDVVIVSHYHGDHVGNAADIAAKIPVRRWYDHGDWTTELQPGRVNGFLSWQPIREKAHVIVPKPGDKLPLSDLDVELVSSAGDLLTVPVAGAPGAGLPNPACKESVHRDQDPTPENQETIGAVIKFGKFRILDLADLTWDQEEKLVCPRNLLGTFDVYHTSRHGTDWAGSPPLVHGARARVAIMNNGPKKGGTLGTWDIIHATPGFQDLWQEHWSELVDDAHNPPKDMVANLNDKDHGYTLKMSVMPDGSFTITNQRNGFTKSYPAASSTLTSKK